MMNEKIADITAAILDKEDCLNLICGVPGIKAMGAADSIKEKLYDYCDKTGVFS